MRAGRAATQAAPAPHCGGTGLLCPARAAQAVPAGFVLFIHKWQMF
jgi:hypothetical protein